MNIPKGDVENMLGISPETLRAVGDLPSKPSREIFDLISRYMMVRAINLHLRQRLLEACSDVQKAAMAVERGELVCAPGPPDDRMGPIAKTPETMRGQWLEWAAEKHKDASRVMVLLDGGAL
jgi:hypothetical protein